MLFLGLEERDSVLVSESLLDHFNVEVSLRYPDLDLIAYGLYVCIYLAHTVLIGKAMAFVRPYPAEEEEEMLPTPKPIVIVQSKAVDLH